MGSGTPGLRREITSAVTFLVRESLSGSGSLPTPKRVYGTLAGSGFGGETLVDSRLVLLPVRLVSLRTIRVVAASDGTETSLEAIARSNSTRF